MKVICPLPPSINATYKTTRTGGFYKSKEARAWTEECQWLIRKAYKHTPTRAEVYVGIDFFFKRDRDIDGGIKTILDALQGLVYENDKQVVQLNVRKYVDKKEPRVEIQVEEIVC